MQRYASDEPGAFVALYEAVGPRLHRFCLRLSRRREEADDLFQDALLRLHRARASYIPGAPPIPWIFAIARSAYLDRIRYQRRRPEELVQLDALDLDLGPPPDGSSPESNVMAYAILRVVERELNRMSENNRAAYVLLREEGLSVAEAAAVLGTSANAVKQRAHRASEKIREALRRSGWDGES